MWYRDPEKLNGVDWMYVFARHRKEAEELANFTKRKELTIVDVEIIP